MVENRKIIHIDMDAFFASVEQLDNPSLRGLPIAVGGSSDRGVVAAASYEARKFGVRSAMASKIAIKNCPKLIFVRPRFERYKEISGMIQAIFHEYSDYVEPLSLDEAFIDVSQPKKGQLSATLIAKEIRYRIKKEIGLNASAGISYNKFLAKIASDINKPNGQFVIIPEEANDFLNRLEIKKFFGVGKKTAEKMNKMGVYFGRDLIKIERVDLVREFGKSGSYFYDIVRGIDNRPVVSNRVRKSIGAERTFSNDIFSHQEIKDEIIRIAEICWNRIESQSAKGKTVSLKIKYSNFQQITRSKTSFGWVRSQKEILNTLEALTPYDEIEDRGCRLIGVTLSNLDLETKTSNDPIQLSFDFTENNL